MEKEAELLYSEAQKKTGRRYFLSFALVNTIAFNFLAGHVILLFFIRLEANNTILGTVSSFVFLSYFFMPFGKLLAHRWGVVKVFARFWLARFVSIIPLIFVPVFADGNRPAAVWISLLTFLVFQTLRGFGIVGYSPVMRELSAGEDRGRFMGQSRLLMDLGMMFTSLAVALLLRGDPPIERFRIFFTAGVVTGAAGSLFLFRIPEPPSMLTLRPVPLFSSLREIFNDRVLRRFFTALFLLTASLGIVYPFLVIHAKRVYLFSDNRTILLTIAGGAGSIAGSLLSRHFTDRYGSKPLMHFFVLQILLVAVAVVLMPTVFAANRPLFLGIYLSLLFFAGTMGYFTIQHIAQVYLFGILSSRQQLNIGILYFLAQGIAGMAGGALGGMLADLLEAAAGLDAALSHRIIFGLAGLLSLIGLSLVRNWREPKAWSFRGSLRDVAGEMFRKGLWWGRAPR